MDSEKNRLEREAITIGHPPYHPPYREAPSTIIKEIWDYYYGPQFRRDPVRLSDLAGKRPQWPT